MSTRLLIWNIALLGFVFAIIMFTGSLLGLLALFLVSWDDGDNTCPKCGYKFEETEE